MIGQSKIISWAENIKELPHFMVIVGDRGSGKRTLCQKLASMFNLIYSPVGIKADEVREVIDTAYYSRTPVLYVFENADTMKAAGMNAMLKITEEPPTDAYFVLTLQSDTALLETIKSRAYVLYMQEYTKQELEEYFWSGISDEGLNVSHDEVELFCSICKVPGEIDLLSEYGKDFYDFVELVLDNIALVQPANAFKSSEKLSLKDDKGYDLKLFFKVFVYICSNKMMDNPEYYAKGILITLPYLNKVSKLGINKTQLYDSWVFKIREVWNEYN